MVGALAGMGLPVIAAQGRQAANSAPISTALSGQVTAPGTASAGPVKIKKSLKFGMVQEEGTILEKFKLLKELGFGGVELDSPANLDPIEVLEAKEATGLEIPGAIGRASFRDSGCQ